MVVSSIITQIDEPEEKAEMEITVPGTYYFKNGKHYVMFEEQEEESGTFIRTRLIFNDSFLDMKKSGCQETSMLFDRTRESLSYYTTPYGRMLMGISTMSYCLEEEGDRLRAAVDYELSMNYEPVSSHHLAVTVKARKQLF